MKKHTTRSISLQMPQSGANIAGNGIVPVLIWLLLCCPSVLAEQRISGAVFEKGTHSPVPGAVVKLEGDLLPAEREVMTDARGRYSFGSLSPGRYTVSASAGGFYAAQVSIMLAPRDVELIEFEMVPLPSVQEQVTVRAQSKPLDETEAATTTTIGREQLDTLPAARRAQLTEIITPFIASAIASHDNLVHLRGNELSLNTFINGVSFFDNPHQLFTPGLAPDVVQSVNVITGGFPAEFGNRFGVTL